MEDAHIKHGQNLMMMMDVDVITVSQKLGLQTVLNTWIESVFYFCFFYSLLCVMSDRGDILYMVLCRSMTTPPPAVKILCFPAERKFRE